MADKVPPGFPRNTVQVGPFLSGPKRETEARQVQRALVAVELLNPEKLTETIAVLYHMSFAEHKEVHTLEVLGPVFERIFGENQAKKLLTKEGQILL